MTGHWLYTWIDEFEIRDGEQAVHLLSLPGPAYRLHEIAKSYRDRQDEGSPTGKSIVAGSMMDFSGRMTCSHSSCLEKQVERLFSRVWHYFDSVVVEGPGTDFYIDSLEGKAKSDFGLDFNVEQDVDFLLHLRDLGVVDHLDFRAKPDHYCAHHLELHAVEAGIPHILDTDFKIEAAKRLKAESEIKIFSGAGGVWRYTLAHPSSSEPFAGHYVVAKRGKGGKKPTKAQIAEIVVRDSIAALIYDVAACKSFSLPLATESSYLNARPNSQRAGRESVIAFDLPLPVMHGMSSKDILKMRADMRPNFDRFQYSLMLAIREQIDRDPERTNPEIAKSVIDEFIRPAYADIERSLTVAKRSFSVKVGSSMAVGSTVASVGLLSSVPLVIGAGLAAIGVTLGGLHKNVDDRKSVASSDIYFLWKATQGRLE